MVHNTSWLSHIYADQQDTFVWKTSTSRQMRTKRKYLCNMTDGYLHVQIHIQTNTNRMNCSDADVYLRRRAGGKCMRKDPTLCVCVCVIELNARRRGEGSRIQCLFGKLFIRWESRVISMIFNADAAMTCSLDSHSSVFAFGGRYTLWHDF